MKAFLIVLFLFIINFSAASQSYYNPELNKVKEQYTTGHQQGKPELVQSAVKGCQELIALYKKNYDQKNLAKTYTLFGQILVENGKFTEAKEVLINALDLSNKKFGSESDETLEAKKYLSWAYGYLGDADTELKYSKEILETYKRNEPLHVLDIADLYNTIGMNYGARNDGEKEREYLFNAQKMIENYKPKNEEESAKVQSLLMNIFNSLSLSFIGSIDYENAIVYARKSLQISEKIAPNSPERTPTMVVIARCYTLEKKCDSAIFYINSALTLLESNQLKGSTMWLSYRSYKVNMLVRCGKVDEAKTEAGNTIKTLLAQGDSPEEALSQLLILSQNKNAELTTMENQYREKETIAAQKKAENEAEILRQKTLRNNIAAAGAIIILTSFISFLFYKRKREAQMQAKISAAHVKTMTAQIEKHFVFGSLLSVKNLIADSPEKAKELITFSSKFLRTTLNLSESTTISLKEELDATENYMQIEKIYHDDNFDFEVHVDPAASAEDILVPPLIFQPIVENSIKHGFNGINYKGKISIDLVKSGNHLVCKIADNGTGFKPKTGSEHKSFGTKLTKERLELFNKLHRQKAVFNIEQSQKGVTVTINIPLKTV